MIRLKECMMPLKIEYKSPASPLWGGQREERSDFERVGVTARPSTPTRSSSLTLAFAGLPTRGRRTLSPPDRVIA